MENCTSPFFVWAYIVHKREFVIEVFSTMDCILYDETPRRRIQHADTPGREILIQEIKADQPGFFQTRKREFSVRFRIESDHFDLLRRAREEFDHSDDVSLQLSEIINRRFAQIFDAEVAPFLTVPIHNS